MSNQITNKEFEFKKPWSEWQYIKIIDFLILRHKVNDLIHGCYFIIPTLITDNTVQRNNYTHYNLHYCRESYYSFFHESTLLDINISEIVKRLEEKATLIYSNVKLKDVMSRLSDHRIITSI